MSRRARRVERPSGAAGEAGAWRGWCVAGAAGAGGAARPSRPSDAAVGRRAARVELPRVPRRGRRPGSARSRPGRARRVTRPSAAARLESSCPEWRGAAGAAGVGDLAARASTPSDAAVCPRAARVELPRVARRGRGRGRRGRGPRRAAEVSAGTVGDVAGPGERPRRRRHAATGRVPRARAPLVTARTGPDAVTRLRTTRSEIAFLRRRRQGSRRTSPACRTAS
jgi:hypothetical protein